MYFDQLILLPYLYSSNQTKYEAWHSDVLLKLCEMKDSNWGGSCNAGV
jgi:hypothetical protein